MTINCWVVKVKTNNGKGNSKWTIELCIATKMRTITTFDHCVKKIWPKDTICNFAQDMLQHFDMTIIVIIVIEYASQIMYITIIVDGMSQWHPRDVMSRKNIDNSNTHIDIL